MAQINTTALAAFNLALASNDEGTSDMGGGGGSDRQQLITTKMTHFLIGCGFPPNTVQVCRKPARVSIISTVGSFVSSHPLRSQPGMFIDWQVKDAAVALRNTIKETGHDVANGYQRMLYSALTLIKGEAKNLPSKTNYGEADVINNKIIRSLWEMSDKTYANSAPANAQLIFRLHDELKVPFKDAVMLTSKQTYNVLSNMKKPAPGVPVSVAKNTIDLETAFNPIMTLGTLCLLFNCEYGFINLPIYVSVFQALERWWARSPRSPTC